MEKAKQAAQDKDFQVEKISTENLNKLLSGKCLRKSGIGQNLTSDMQELHYLCCLALTIRIFSDYVASIHHDDLQSYSKCAQSSTFFKFTM